MGILRNIFLTVGLLWTILFRIYPLVAGTVSAAPIGPHAIVKQDTHSVAPSTDSAVYLVQSEDEQTAPTAHPDGLPALPVEWQHLLLTSLLLLPLLFSFVEKPVVNARPYYLLYCSLRIPLV